MSFFSYRLVTAPTLSAFQRRLSSVLCTFSRKEINFIRVSPPWMVSPGAVHPLPFPPSDATERVQVENQITYSYHIQFANWK